jgi:UDP-3-O-[3-hydroxymyristoyl] glucosamine N-acyltransferase
MFKLKKQEIFASDISQFLNVQLVGEDIRITGPYNLVILSDDFQNSANNESEKPTLYFSKSSDVPPYVKSYVVSANPIYDIALILKDFFSTPTEDGIHKTAQIGTDVAVGRNVRVGANSVIDSDVEISDNVWIMDLVSIHGPVKIGKFSVIKSGSVIGSEGYSFLDDGRGNFFHPPQLGRIIIGNNVWIGSNSTIERGMLEDTIIEDGVKIDDLVHIGKGSHIGKNCMITAGCVIAYNVTLGSGVTLGPNVTVRELLKITNDVIVGQGAAVIKNIDKKGVYAGVPAKFLKKEMNIGKDS